MVDILAFLLLPVDDLDATSEVVAHHWLELMSLPLVEASDSWAAVACGQHFASLQTRMNDLEVVAAAQVDLSDQSMSHSVAMVKSVMIVLCCLVHVASNVLEV